MTTETHLPANGLPPAPGLPAAPRARDPIALAGITITAVDQIGESAAFEIEKAATQLEAGAVEVADKLRRLATAVREHSRIAGEHVEEFCSRSTTVIETVRTLQARLAGKDQEQEDGPAPIIPLRGASS
jgi:hypothetical protein